MKSQLGPLLATVFLFFAGQHSAQAESPFPNRVLFPKVETIELEELYARRNEIVVVDVRTHYEYETLHIKGALNISIADERFLDSLQSIRDNDPRPMAFYCNGHTCKKSYQAAQKARQRGIDRVYAYDAGIFEWTKAHPAEAVLLGKSPADPARLIGKEKFEAHLLAPEQFAKQVEGNSLVLDIRDPSQRTGLALFPMKQRWVMLDNAKLKGHIDRVKQEGKTLLVYDNVGKEVQWLQYYLEEEGVSSYYFLRGGARAFFEFLMKDGGRAVQ